MDTLRKTQKFWAILILPGTQQLRHLPTYDEAVAEAQKVAAMYPSTTVYVIESVAAFRAEVNVERLQCVSAEEAHARGWASL